VVPQDEAVADRLGHPGAALKGNQIAPTMHNTALRQLNQ
jgi:hypothetical protein